MFKKVTYLLCLGLMIFSLGGCDDGEIVTDKDTSIEEGRDAKKDANTEENQTVEDESENKEPETWAVYWYLNGCDLESECGAATNDLDELMQVQLPENIKIIIETGGTTAWQNDIIDPSVKQRFTYTSEGFNLVEESENENMGDPNTLADFLSFASNNYPADNTMVLFWNHGGGSVNGVAVDHNFDGDSLTLTEMDEAFSMVYEKNKENPPIDIIGFDTCLMATIDTASMASNYASYLVASEEVEPGNGWYYTGWVGALADNLNMSPADLGKVICDSYKEGCELAGTELDITLSLTDLSKIDSLLHAYEELGLEMLSEALFEPEFVAKHYQIAQKVENYGGNTREQGYINMVDLGDMVDGIGDYFDEDVKLGVLEAIEDAVIYKVNGEGRKEATGLSCYHSYNGDLYNLEGYMEQGVSQAFKYYYKYALTGVAEDEMYDYYASSVEQYELTEPDPEVEMQPLMTIKDLGYDGQPLILNDDGSASIELGQEAQNVLMDVYFNLYCMDSESDTLVMLGRDNDLVGDWESGIFTDNFRGVWGSLDGATCYMELAEVNETYNIYTIPIMIGEEHYNLFVKYDFEEAGYSILGVKEPIDEETGMPDKSLEPLNEGDVVSPILYTASISGDDEYEPVILDEVTITSTTSFSEIELADGEYAMQFEMVDMQNNSAYSSTVYFDIEGGEIYTSVEE